MTASPAPCAGVVHVVYATQTGNAEEIARRIVSDLRDRGRRDTPAAVSLSSHALCPAFASTPSPPGSIAALVVVAATTGDGDAPDAVRPFMRYLRGAAKGGSALAHVRYAMLGLGDTNYENFCQCAKKIDIALGKAGAKPFVPRGLADDGVGLDEVVEPWIDALYPAVDALLAPPAGCLPTPPAAVIPAVEAAAAASDAPVEETPALAAIAAARAPATIEDLGFSAGELPALLTPSLRVVPGLASTDAAPPSTSSFYDAATTVHAPIVGTRTLTHPDAQKTVYHIELDCAGVNPDAASFAYAPGDAFGVLVENKLDDVAELLKYVAGDFEHDAVVRVEKVGEAADVLAVGSPEELLSQRVDLRASPKKTLLRALADCCSNVEDTKALLSLSSKSGKKEYASKIVDAEAGIFTVLTEIAPSCRPPLALLLDQLPPLAPRYYSAASAPETDGLTVHFAFSVVANGLATTALAARCNAFASGADPADIPPVLLIPRASDASSAFRPPQDLAKPYIMVGPGTGVAPFRGFLRQRDALLATARNELPGNGETMLFFGCRNKQHDFLYAEELSSYVGSRTLSILDVAFSRAGPEKTYVQHRLAARGEQVAAALQAGAALFVCGDGGGMAAGVDAALREIVAEFVCDGDSDEAKRYMKVLAEEGRYIRDIWYFGAEDE
jgi:sulfite reductase alpha subunit-like flavoprotein